MTLFTHNYNIKYWKLGVSITNKVLSWYLTGNTSIVIIYSYHYKSILICHSNQGRTILIVYYVNISFKKNLMFTATNIKKGLKWYKNSTKVRTVCNVSFFISKKYVLKKTRNLPENIFKIEKLCKKAITYILFFIMWIVYCFYH